MKRITSIVAIIGLLLVLCSCNQQVDAPSWQEQYALGIRYLSEGNYEEAIIAFTAAIEIDPKRTEAYIGRGDARLAMGDEDAAAENYAFAVEYGDEAAQEKLDALKKPTAVEGYPKTERRDSSDGYWLLDYNENAKLIKESFYSIEDILAHFGTYEYNDAGERVKYSSYGADGALVGYYIYEGTDSNGNSTQCWYDASGVLQSREVTTAYNPTHGYESLIYDADGTLRKRIIHNSDGSWQKEIFYASDGTVQEEIVH